jgi:CDP-glucose 4,6-dehydratase
MELNPRFWRGRKVLVTGHTGFKGSWLCLWLQEMGAELSGYGLGPPTEPSLFRAARVGESMRSIHGDVADLDAVESALASERPEVVIHMAAQPIVSRGLRDPAGTFETNVMGTVSVLEAARRTRAVRVVVNVTSDKCYEDRGTGEACREGDPLGGRDPYSASKACSEIVSAAYRSSYFGEVGSTALATARAGNVIGGGDWAEDRLIPDVMRAALAHAPVVVRRPGAVRPWQHVLDPVSGYLLLAERLWEEPEKYARAWNFAPGPADAWPVQRVVERISELWSEPIQVETGGDEFLETDYLRLDSSQAREQLGWASGWSPDRSLQAVAEWYRGWRDCADPRALTVAQLRSHPAAAALAAAA